MPEANARRTMLAQMMKPALGKMAQIGVAGIAATALVQAKKQKE